MGSVVEHKLNSDRHFPKKANLTTRSDLVVRFAFAQYPTILSNLLLQIGQNCGHKRKMESAETKLTKRVLLNGLAPRER